jgi:hypothetical protein
LPFCFFALVHAGALLFIIDVLGALDIGQSRRGVSRDLQRTLEPFVWSFVFVMIPRGVQIVMNHSTLRGRCVNCGDDRRGDSATKCPKWGFADEGEEGLVCSCWVVQVLQAARSCARSAPLMMPLRSKSPRHTCSQAGPGGAPLLRLLKIQ